MYSTNKPGLGHFGFFFVNKQNVHTHQKGKIWKVCLVCAAHTQETEVKVSSTLCLTECERFLHAHNPHAHNSDET